MVEKDDIDETLRASPLVQQLGIEVAFSDEEGPPLDDMLIRRYLDRDLKGEEARTVERNISRFRSWFVSCDKALQRPGGSLE